MPKTGISSPLCWSTVDSPAGVLYHQILQSRIRIEFTAREFPSAYLMVPFDVLRELHVFGRVMVPKDSSNCSSFYMFNLNKGRQILNEQSLNCQIVLYRKHLFNLISHERFSFGVGTRCLSRLNSRNVYWAWTAIVPAGISEAPPSSVILLC